ncbi:MAG: tol-pal system YbgF family protein, partial [Gemmatimonadota bacterium]
MSSPIRRSASALVARRSRTGATPRSRLGALVLLAALSAPLAAQESPALFVEGVERYRAGEYGEAQRRLREYVEAFGERRGPQAEHLGEAYHYLGLMTADARLAEGYFLAVAQRYPATPLADESVARLAQLHAVRGDHADARERWRALAR